MIEELFYDEGAVEGMYRLSQEESQHIVRVLRKKVGDIIHITNGRGDLFLAELLDPTTKGCLLNLQLAHLEQRRRNFSLCMAVAPTKNISRFEWFIEKAIELGVDMIIPLLTEHSERKSINSSRLEKIAIAAMKQSFKLELPKIQPPMSMVEALNLMSDWSIYLARLDEEKVPHLADKLGSESNICILIGPEGDFSVAEKNFAISHGARQVHLGPSRLRTETAALAACHTVHLIRR